jgi:hypothetical protein
MHIPEDLCVKCLLLIAKQTGNMWNNNIALEKKKVSDLEQKVMDLERVMIV